MGCETCTNGKNGQPAGCKNNGTCSSGGCSKLAVYDWLANMDLPGQVAPFEYVEIRFKNTRKEFYRNSEKLSLNPGDAVIVECSPGYDVGIVAAAGEMARLQMQKKNATKNTRDLKRILRKASTPELEIWRDARALEHDTMLKARSITSSLKLDMKVGDVEYQGDKSKAIFYYTAEGRVDFRELIRKLADTFRVRIEMRQIGARQEAGRLGGIGSCGRELCCSTWLTDFRSVSTSAALYQQLALNTQKLAGQCGKLKCCLNYELDSYLDALKHFPKNHAKIKTKKGSAVHIKTDIFKGILWYVYEEGGTNSPMPLTIERTKEIISLNEKGQFPDDLKDFNDYVAPVVEAYASVDAQDSLSRFDEKKGKRRNKKRKPDGNRPQRSTPQGAAPGGEKSAQTAREPRKDGAEPRKQNRRKPARNPNNPRNTGDTPTGNSPAQPQAPRSGTENKGNRPPRSEKGPRRKPRNKDQGNDVS